MYFIYDGAVRSARALRFVLVLAAALPASGGCGATAGGASGPATQPQLDRDDPRAAPLLDDYRADFALAWAGQPLGRARERLTRRAGGGYRFERSEHWRIARDGRIVDGALRLVVDTDAALTARRIALYRGEDLGGEAVREPDGGEGGTGRAHRSSGGPGGTGRADRSSGGPGGWLIRVPGEPVRRVTGRAVPAELVPLWLARRRQARWRGPVLLAGLGFATASLSVTPDGHDARLVELRGAAGTLATRVDLAVDGTVERARGPDLTEWRLAPRAPAGAREADDGPPGRPAMAPSAPPPDVIALGSVPVEGRPGPAIELTRGARAWRVELSGLPPELATPRGSSARTEPAPSWPPPAADPPPSPVVRALADRIVARAGATDPLAQARALVRATSRRVAGDLASDPAARAAQVLARGRADCVGHAVLLSSLARARGLRVRLVIGFHLDGARLVRHEWAAIDAGGGRWVAVDPTTGDAPVLPGRYLALAAHGSAPAELALAAELAYAGLRGARARFAARRLTAPRSARSTPRTP